MAILTYISYLKEAYKFVIPVTAQRVVVQKAGDTISLLNLNEAI